jgi:hypothetical protein
MIKGSLTRRLLGSIYLQVYNTVFPDRPGTRILKPYPMKRGVFTV